MIGAIQVSQTDSPNLQFNLKKNPPSPAKKKIIENKIELICKIRVLQPHWCYLAERTFPKL